MAIGVHLRMHGGPATIYGARRLLAPSASSPCQLIGRPRPSNGSQTPAVVSQPSTCIVLQPHPLSGG